VQLLVGLRREVDRESFDVVIEFARLRKFDDPDQLLAVAPVGGATSGNYFLRLFRGKNRRNSHSEKQHRRRLTLCMACKGSGVRIPVPPRTKSYFARTIEFQ
jgi:hypothetical protein